MLLQNQYNQLIERARALLSEVTSKLSAFAKIGTESAGRIRRRQFMLGGGIVIGIIAFAYGIMTVLFDRGPVQQESEAPKPVSTNIATATSHVDMKEARWSNLDTGIKNLGKEISEIKKTLYGDAQSSASDGTTIETQKNENPNNTDGSAIQGSSSTAASDRDAYIQELETKILHLEADRDAQQQTPPVELENPYPTQGISEEQDGRVIQKLSIPLTHKEKNLHTVETTIPAGAFAKTVLLSGLDASSAMNASSDPRPMLLRIIDHGTLPRRFQSDLKDCHCTAGAYGDLSSERVYARLEKLTCVARSTGEIIETQVAGYVAGSDGKAGIRGIVASKDGQFLARSLMGGIFAGLSNVANPQNRRAQVNPFFGGGTAGSQASGPSIGENFTAGMAGGATTALDRLSQYYIDRAEQLQPVIQIAAGQVVDIVFTEGASISAQYSVSSIQKKEEKGENK
jgi:conjugal transfer pilus assembly protein TraB